MTSPRKSALVLDGSEVKLRLQAHRTHSKTPVHVDWVRFTCLLRNAPTPAANILFPDNRLSIWDEKNRAAALTRAIDEVVSVYELGDGKVVDLGTSSLRLAAMQALELARLTAECLGTDYAVEDAIKKGHDFYKHRWPILRNGTECGWVGFGASSDSPQQKSQARTIHVNLFGAACTFAKPGWNHRIANLIDAHDGDVNRSF